MQNVKPQCKNQDSAGGMDNFSPRNLFAYIAIITQNHIVRQTSKAFDKTTYFFAKQSQFSKKSNGCILNYNKGL